MDSVNNIQICVTKLFFFLRISFDTILIGSVISSKEIFPLKFTNLRIFIVNWRKYTYRIILEQIFLRISSWKLCDSSFYSLSFRSDARFRSFPMHFHACRKCLETMSLDSIHCQRKIHRWKTLGDNGGVSSTPFDVSISLELSFQIYSVIQNS